MSTPSYVDPRLADSLKCWHTAPGGRAGTVALSRRQYFADGDGVTVLMRVSGTEALASDGGAMVTRLADAGVDVWSTTRASKAWTDILASYRLTEIDGRMVGRCPVAQAGRLASDVASAMLMADGLRYFAGAERESKLQKQLYDFLDGNHIRYSKRPTIKLPRGSEVRPTARVDTPARPVLVQTVGGTEQGIEHALSLVQRIDRANFAFNQRLVLLKGNPDEWPEDHLDLLADHSPVAFSSAMDQVRGFLSEDRPLPRPVPASISE